MFCCGELVCFFLKGDVVRIKKEVLGRPTNRKELQEWVAEHCGLVLPAKAVCAGHDSPLDYVEHAFFEKGDCYVWACRGGGKTVLGAVVTLLDMLFKPEIQVRILAGSAEQGEKMYEYLKEFVEKNFKSQVAGKITSRGFKFKNKSRVEVLSQSEKSVRGTHVHKLRCDEVELFTPEVWQAAMLTTKSKKMRKESAGYRVRGTVEGFSTMHLPNGLMNKLVKQAEQRGVRVFRWCAWDVAEKCLPTRDCARCPLWESCQGACRESRGYFAIEDLIDMQKRVSTRVWKNEVMCERPKWEEAVFDGFDLARHVKTMDVWKWEDRRLVLGVDFGFAGAFAAVWLMVSGRGEQTRAHVMGEFVQSRAPLKHNLLMLGMAMGELWPTVAHVDPAGIAVNPQTGISDVRAMKDDNYNVNLPRGGVMESLGMMERMLMPAIGEPLLTVDPKCEQLIAAMENYKWEAARMGKPDKDGVHDHVMDALRYALMGEVMQKGRAEMTQYA
jgi:hypothetical protein